MAAEIGPIEKRVAAGEEAVLQTWLGQTVWPLGRSVNGEELVRAVSGRPLSAEPFLAHLRQKVAQLTG
jgi:carboxypeptidase Taq